MSPRKLSFISFLSLSALVLTVTPSVCTSTFIILNRCHYTVWPGVLSNAGWPLLEDGGFKLEPGQSRSLNAPSGWSGRLWARTGCSFSSSGEGTCASGDCGGKLQCNGAGAAPPASLAEFTLAGSSSSISCDFYDVSLVDGYNLPIAIFPHGGSGSCGAAGCSSNLNHNCPAELQVVDDENVVACKSACYAFGLAQYCCIGAYGNPTTCRPSFYSQIFKSACPRAYTYAFDDPTSTFTCSGADYTITFCPDSSSRKKISNSSQSQADLLSSRNAWTASNPDSPPSSDARSTAASMLLGGVTLLVVVHMLMGPDLKLLFSDSNLSLQQGEKKINVDWHHYFHAFDLMEAPPKGVDGNHKKETPV